LAKKKKQQQKQSQPAGLTDAQRTALARIRLRRLWFWAFAATYLPAGYFVMEKWKEAFFGFVLLWTGGLAISVIRLRIARCPRCRGFYHVRRTKKGWGWGMTLGKQCLSCGLKLDADHTGVL
jgi:hypothetical protein